MPSHSVLMLDSRDEALALPRGDMRIAFCPACGFITNTAFDVALNAYSGHYEESQAYSPRFRAFAEALAQRWIDTYDIRGKTVLEIGCGKGSFLQAICELGDNKGVGVDPSARHDRLDDPDGRITLIQDLYSERYADLAADVVICRHTLEHIHPVADFMGTVRAAIGDRLATIVLFELPDVQRVLDDLAFWDVYYEHCSYFSAGSLARLFRRTGFEVLDVRREYDDQYLTIDAVPSTTPAQGEPLPIEDDLAVLAASVERFARELPPRLEAWRTQLREVATGGGRAVVWGGGSKGVTYVNTLQAGGDISCLVDINPHMQGKFIAGAGLEIVAPERLREIGPDVVFLMNPIYRDEVRADLDRVGVGAELVAV
ncbi:MAG: class I SAM-dependent methyltransferase [Acidimicrobiales bacterium]